MDPNAHLAALNRRTVALGAGAYICLLVALTGCTALKGDNDREDAGVDLGAFVDLGLPDVDLGPSPDLGAGLDLGPATDLGPESDLGVADMGACSAP